MTDTNAGSGDRRTLINCTNCDWWTVVEGPTMLADYEREAHGDSIRNWRTDGDLCPMDGIAWVSLPSSAEVST